MTLHTLAASRELILVGACLLAVTSCEGSGGALQTTEVGFFDEEVRDDGSGGTVCADLCTDEATRCHEGLVQLCARGRSGCFGWLTAIDCNASRRSCDDSVEPPTCGQACDDPCDDDGASRCSGDTIQRCVFRDDLCLAWTDISVCTDAGRACEIGPDDEARCIGGCADECRTEGAERCFEHKIQTCQLQDDGCSDWVDVENCSDDEQVCDPTMSPIACHTCDDPCEPGARRCIGQMLEGCAYQPSTCWQWQSFGDCDSFGQVCDDSGDFAYCRCPTECPFGQSRCQGDSIERCDQNPNGCLDWFEQTNCSDVGQTCQLTDGVAVCSD